MMNKILGKGGFARELAGLLDEPQLFEDAELTAVEQAVLTDTTLSDHYYIGVGDPVLKEKWARKLEALNAITPFLLARVSIVDYDQSSRIGPGSILCNGVIVTTNVKIGKFVTLNLNVTVGHDSVIGDYTTIAPGTNISGNVKIGKSCNIGSNVVIIPGVELPDNGVIGAGSVVTKSPNLQELWDNCEKRHTTPFKAVHDYVMVGNPAKVIKINGVRV